MNTIKIVLCDDAKYLCDGFCEQFKEFEDISIVGVCYSAQQCLNTVKETCPDILLLDITMETETSGIDIIPTLKKENPDLKIIMLTGNNDEQYIFRAFAYGAEDFCEKTLDFQEIVTSIRNVYNDQIVLRTEISKKLVQITRNVITQQQSLLYMYNKMAKLSLGELEVLRALYYGSSYRQIAKDKCVEADSVKKMTKRLLNRLDAKNINILLEQLRQLRIFEFIDQAKDINNDCRTKE